MKNIEIVDVAVSHSEVIVSLLGGDTNIVGALYLEELDPIKLHDLRRRVEALMKANVLVDLAMAVTTRRWRLLGKNREIIGGLEPTRLSISQTIDNTPKKPHNWGLDAPWKDEEF